MNAIINEKNTKFDNTASVCQLCIFIINFLSTLYQVLLFMLWSQAGDDAIRGASVVAATVTTRGDKDRNVDDATKGGLSPPPC